MNRRLLFLLLVPLVLAGLWVGLYLTDRGVSDVPLPNLEQSHPLVQSAIRESAERLSQDIRAPAMWGRHGMVLLAHGFLEEALLCFEQASRGEPQEIRWHYYTGYIRESDDPEAAVVHYQSALRCDSRYIPAKIRLAHLLLRLDRDEEARTQLQEALDLVSDNPYVLLERARLAISQDELELSRQLLERAVTLPNWYSRPAYVELSRVCTQLGDETAASAARQVVMSLPETATTDMPDPLLRAVELERALAQDLAEKADQMMARGEWAQAIVAFEQLSQTRPEFPRPRFNLAYCLAMTGQSERAIAIYRELCAQFPDDVNAHYALAVALQDAGETAQAIEAFQDTILLKRDHTAALFSLGLLLEEAGRFDEASAAYRGAVRADPGHAPAHLALGTLLYRIGEPREVFLPHLEAAVALAPGDPVPQRHLDEALATPLPGQEQPAESDSISAENDS